MRPRRVVARERAVGTAFAAIYDRLSAEGRARLLAFCHLIDPADVPIVRFEIGPSGGMVLSLELADDAR